jgi:hypothetical protein
MEKIYKYQLIVDGFKIKDIENHCPLTQPAKRAIIQEYCRENSISTKGVKLLLVQNQTTALWQAHKFVEENFEIANDPLDIDHKNTA